jgi:hypothetical protein
MKCSSSHIHFEIRIKTNKSLICIKYKQIIKLKNICKRKKIAALETMKLYRGYDNLVAINLTFLSKVMFAISFKHSFNLMIISYDKPGFFTFSNEYEAGLLNAPLYVSVIKIGLLEANGLFNFYTFYTCGYYKIIDDFSIDVIGVCSCILVGCKTI